MKSFVRNHFEDFVNRKKSEVALKNFSTDFLDHDGPTGVEVGPEAAEKMMRVAYKRWPDLKVIVEDILARRQSYGAKFMDGYGTAHWTKNRIPWIRLVAFCKQEDSRALGDHYVSRTCRRQWKITPSYLRIYRLRLLDSQTEERNGYEIRIFVVLRSKDSQLRDTIFVELKGA
ncbi:MAG: hypothetical protein ACYC9U_12540 [Nitrososphaerales archaeon]